MHARSRISWCSSILALVLAACGGGTGGTSVVVPCVAGVACTATNPCRTAATTCPSAEAAAVCTETGNKADSTVCGTGLTCRAGVCVSAGDSGTGTSVVCAAGSMCTPANPCQIGTCVGSGATASCQTAGNKIDGTPCGDGGTCRNGTCRSGCGEQCDLELTAENACRTGLLRCQGGTQTCVPAEPRADGASCGTGQVCRGGQCLQACVAGLPCQPENACANGTTVCSSLYAAATCAVTGNKADGASCGTGRACAGGTCGPIASISRVFVYDTVTTVNTSVAMTADVTVGSGSPSRELTWSVESEGTVSPVRGTSTWYHAPWSPGRFRVWATSVADPSKRDFGYVVVRPAGTPILGPVTAPVGRSPWGLLVAGGYVWVSNSASNSVSRLQADSGAVSAVYNVGAGPRGDMATLYSDVWVTNTSDNTLTRIPIYGGPAQTYAPYWSGSLPHGVTSCNGYLWVALWGSNSVARLYFDGSYLGVWGTTSVASQPRALTCDGNSVWVASNAAVTKLRATDGVVLGSYGGVENPYGITYDSTTDSIWVANYGGNTVVKLRAWDGLQTGRYTVGSAPFGIKAHAGTIWVANSGSDTVWELRATDGAQVAILKSGAQPRGIDVSGDEPWVANFDGNDVRRLY